MIDSKIDVKYVADLARLELTDSEVNDFTKQLTEILTFVKQLENVDTSGIEPTAHAQPVFNVIRNDISRDGFGSDSALKNAPNSSKNQFKVPRVVD
ncbi:MAG: Asp-tRNA(Asn)/Glu-tRNA(Gln) amidotransferase GatCAB subunit C [Verrucomicrobiales bacterium]|nr:Asp-tRNA(Asn)/Glu-tRNA(Gln) amidotransferase GatCAB subunit C [Verrucomicrobiales bacterium]MBV64467.1 Asp-tRNA(Asn)/Glu-tRNA(Gln) amidotransferase GatCAB subunit C [Rickettsiales bacterium]|tara:strand:+ start:145 stop:432 length:288 start_codon:yes stop_codon:yes gene_type:complete